MAKIEFMTGQKDKETENPSCQIFVAISDLTSEQFKQLTKAYFPVQTSKKSSPNPTDDIPHPINLNIASEDEARALFNTMKNKKWVDNLTEANDQLENAVDEFNRRNFSR